MTSIKAIPLSVPVIWSDWLFDDPKEEGVVSMGSTSPPPLIGGRVITSSSLSGGANIFWDINSFFADLSTLTLKLLLFLNKELGETSLFNKGLGETSLFNKGLGAAPDSTWSPEPNLLKNV